MRLIIIKNQLDCENLYLTRAGWATLIELGIEDVEINKEDLEELYIPNLQTLNLTHSDEFYDYSRFSNYVYIQKE